jgi:hypothetical protein
MMNKVNVDSEGKTVILTNLAVISPDFFSVVISQPETAREQTVLDIIAIGSAAMQRVQTTVDVDFVEKRFGAMSASFERALLGLEKQAAETITKRFSPTESGSYTKHISELIGNARKDFQGWTTELEKAARSLLDPDKKSSAVGRLDDLIRKATEEFEEMFNPDVKDSYAARLNEHLSSLFGGDGRPGILGASLQEALQPVLRELRELKEKIESRKAAEQVIASSTLKGRPFEEQVQARLAQLAQPFGDDVLYVGSGNGGSKAGDFLITVNGSGKRMVVEARDRREMSLPAIKDDLEREMVARAADFGLYISSSAGMLPQHVGDFQVYGDKVVTTLDNLHIGYRLARLLALSETPDGEVDLGALRAVLAKIKDAARSLRDVKSKASQIQKLAEGIHSDAEGTEGDILDMLEEAERLLGGKSQT